MFRFRIGIGVGLLAWLSAFPAPVGAVEVCFSKAVSELTLTEGRLPERPDPRPGFGAPQGRPAMQPYAVIEGPGEVYLSRPENVANNFGLVGPLDWLAVDDVVAFRLPERREVSGRLFVRKGDGTGLVAVPFKTTPPAPEAGGKAIFARAKSRHYERLLSRGLPGAAWFLHQAREADPLAPPAGGRLENGQRRATDLEQTFDLFSGDRALQENLQLDRPIRPGAPVNGAQGGATVKTESLKGITVAEIDWSARLKERTPTLDPLAAQIPADQHAVFFSGLKAAAALLAETNGDALSILHLVETRSEDRRVQRRYERQLGVSLADLGRFAGADLIKSLALTGSDPYFPSGTDLAVLIETGAPDALKEFLTKRLDDARGADPAAISVVGEIDGVRLAGVKTPDRSLSAYVAAIGPVVAIANSTTQLARIVAAAHDKTPALAAQPEYRFFRDRYPRGDDDETGFLVLTDATIRRWCGPAWRIGSSRRLRAAAVLGQLQAANLAFLAGAGPKDATPLKAPAGAIDLGPHHLSRSGVRSETYGTLAFLTPIAELPLAEVDRDEAEAYARWRDTYQSNWRGIFDPIALKLSVGRGRLAADLTVMPLIAGSTYQPFLDLAGDAQFAPGAGDPHPGSLVHAIMALDLKSKWVGQGRDMIANAFRVPQQVALGWLGSSVGLYLDDDPFWADLAAAQKPREYVGAQVGRLPIAAHAEVTDGVKLALFLAGLRTFVDQSAPNLTIWENREHLGQRYVRIAEAPNARPADNGPKFVLYYYASPRALTVSLSEAIIQRAIQRQQAKGEPGPGPWVGKSAALHVSRRGFEALASAGRTELRDQLQDRSWDNLPILNEWKRLFPDQDSVALHERIWGTTLVDPGGGRYEWNAKWETMESTVFGHPGEPKPGHEMNNPVSRFDAVAFGLTFEAGGLRARTEVELRPNP